MRVFTVQSFTHDELQELIARRGSLSQVGTCADSVLGSHLRETCGIDGGSCPGLEHCPYDSVQVRVIKNVTFEGREIQSSGSSFYSAFSKPLFNPVLTAEDLKPPVVTVPSTPEPAPVVPVETPSHSPIADEDRYTSQHPLYKKWYRLHSGTSLPGSFYWDVLGGKGIKLHAPWHDFVVFAKYWIKAGWTPESRLQKRSRNGDYTPDNMYLK